MLVAEKVFFCFADILPPLFIQFAFADKIEEMQYIVLWKMFKIAMRQLNLVFCFCHTNT